MRVHEETSPNREPRKGRFGEYGGQYVPETLMPCLLELEEVYAQARADATFQNEFQALLEHYSGRPTPLYLAPSLGEHYGGRTRIYLKR